MKGLNLLYKKSIILLFFILLNTINMFPCTIFCAHYNGEVWAGNNEDWNDQDTWIWFIPGNETSYGRIFTGYESAFAQGGMNEKGLFFDKFQRNNTGILAPNDPNKLNYKSSLPILPEKILAECATVTEALEFYDTYNEPFLGSYIFFFADSSGDSATIGWNWQTKKVEITRTSKNYQVIGASEGAVT
ncbi:MAG: hypothetical protein JXB17_13630, partial [Bacteroidales bacterium]|nr:hypothetical protein [Bacteroidales bacterium]